MCRCSAAECTTSSTAASQLLRTLLCLSPCALAAADERARVSAGHVWLRARRVWVLSCCRAAFRAPCCTADAAVLLVVHLCCYRGTHATAAVHAAVCRAEVSGTIVKILCENGDAVLPGARLWLSAVSMCMECNLCFMLCLALLVLLAPSVSTCPHYCPHCCPTSLPSPLRRPAAVHHQALSWQQAFGCSICAAAPGWLCNPKKLCEQPAPTRRCPIAPRSFRCTLLCSSCRAASGKFCAPVLWKWKCLRLTRCSLIAFCSCCPPPLPSQLFFSACPPPLINAACCKAVKLCIAALS